MSSEVRNPKSRPASGTPEAGVHLINERSKGLPVPDCSLVNTFSFGCPEHGACRAAPPSGCPSRLARSDPGLPGGQPFISVLDALQCDGFNPLWREFQIAFTTGHPHTPRQMTSDNEVAAAVQSGEITLQATNEVYICSVVGSKK